MNELRLEKIAHELSITTAQVRATAQLIGEAATVPFIARYRKEVTGSLDEVAITSIEMRLLQLEELDSRRDAIYLRAALATWITCSEGMGQHIVLLLVSEIDRRSISITYSGQTELRLRCRIVGRRT